MFNNMDKFLKENMEKKKPELRFTRSDCISLKLEKGDNRVTVLEMRIVIAFEEEGGSGVWEGASEDF